MYHELDGIAQILLLNFARSVVSASVLEVVPTNNVIYYYQAYIVTYTFGWHSA